MAGTSRERPDLAGEAIPLEIVVAPVPAAIDSDLPQRFFAPVGWQVDARRIHGPDGPAPYVELHLSGCMRLAEALTHLYVLIGALDADKHYWVGADEIDKLIDKGGAWLAGHPERAIIARRFLKNQYSLTRAALARLAPEAEGEPADADGGQRPPQREAMLEAPQRLHERRLDAVAALLKACGARSVADLGCGEGRLLQRLVGERQFERLIGLDASTRDLERAATRLGLRQAGGVLRDRVTLLHGALTYRDERLHGMDAAVLVEVIEHLDADRLPALVSVVFGAMRPGTVIITTPNAEYNALFEALPAGAFRHPDHRFEWTRADFHDWARRTAEAHGYAVTFSGIGDEHPAFGPVSQVGVFTR